MTKLFSWKLFKLFHLNFYYEQYIIFLYSGSLNYGDFYFFIFLFLKYSHIEMPVYSIIIYKNFDPTNTYPK